MHRSKVDIRKSMICHNCGEDISPDLTHRSRKWAFGMVGVRWLTCSAKCAELVGAK